MSARVEYSIQSWDFVADDGHTSRYPCLKFTVSKEAVDSLTSALRLVENGEAVGYFSTFWDSLHTAIHLLRNSAPPAAIEELAKLILQTPITSPTVRWQYSMTGRATRASDTRTAHRQWAAFIIQQMAARDAIAKATGAQA